MRAILGNRSLLALLAFVFINFAIILQQLVILQLKWVLFMYLILGDGFYGGISVDNKGILVATRSEKARHFIQAIQCGQILNTIDSHNSRLCRPTGLMCTNDNHVVVVDLGNDCVKKYRYL